MTYENKCLNKVSHYLINLRKSFKNIDCGRPR